jgi:UDP-N-acetylmuramoylalanine--D-glutamate ligase
MLDIISKLIRGKKVLILGFGKEGKSTFNLLKRVGTFSDIGIADINEPKVGSNVSLFYGDNYLESICKYDIVFKSPGIALPKPSNEYNCNITSQTEVF